jgi:hypothetical protein
MIEPGTSSPSKATTINFYSGGTRLFSWTFVGEGIKSEKVSRAVTRLQAVGTAKQLPEAVVQVVEVSRNMRRKRILIVKVAVSVLQEDGRTWINMDSEDVLPSEFMDEKVFEQMP